MSTALVTGLSALGLSPDGAGAQAVAVAAPPPAENAIPEVVVTALRRSESLQKVPAAVTAFTAERIEAAGITKPSDFIAQTSNVTLVQTQNAGSSFVVIRGVSQARNSEPSVAVVVDGVQQVNPSQFNQELFDVQQIEVLKGPQGGLYGRNAIGGAIVITTKLPTDDLQGRLKAGVDSGPGYKVQAGVSGPLAKAQDIKFRLGLSYENTDGYIPNTYLGKPADPVRDLSAHGDVLWQISPDLNVDLRASADLLHTQGFYYNVTANGANDVSLPVRVNNPGKDERKIYELALKVDRRFDAGTLTSVTSYDTVREIVSGDGTNFLPIKDSFLYKLYGFDLTQSQFLDVRSLSEELRWASPTDRRISYIVGAYAVGTDRYISTSNLIDTGAGASAIYKVPSVNPLNPTYSFLADQQKNFAWAAFGNLTWRITDKLEFDGSLRYDSDHRRQTTLTPTVYLPNVPGFPSGATGDVRAKTFAELQPKATLNYKLSPVILLYGTYSRGFRSGGFNQTGVAAISAASGFVGVRDYFDAEVADTFEAGVKTQWFEHRLDLNAAVYTTKSTNGYFFFYLATNGTQNLGNIPETRFNGFEVEAAAHPIRGLDINLGFGYTDSNIRKFADPTVIGNQSPLVSQYTANAGVQYKHSLPLGNDVSGVARLDYQRIGPTYFDVYNTTTRDPVDLVDVRAGLEFGRGWSVYAWAKNLTDTLYNAEWAPGGFVFKAEPRRYGVEITRNF